MNIISMRFLLFILGTMVVYYAIPGKFRWLCLLAASTAFYLLSGWQGFIFVLISATSVFFGAKEIEKRKTGKKPILIAVLALNFGILAAFKLIGGNVFGFTWSLAVPLGLSFYTFQITGYILDVYWEKAEAQKNWAKMLLFTSFFPQITQGPISDYPTLSRELFTPHAFTYENFSQGGARLLWGLAKKVLLANQLSPFVKALFRHSAEYSAGTVLLGAFAFSILIYADFSGYMDIMCGVSRMFGITLRENFARPYFSRSVAEYWRRWHISLGDWFKNYLYYPIAMSPWSRRLAKKMGKYMSKVYARLVPATVALVIVWLATGLWHGVTGAYVAWGLANGIAIILSQWTDRFCRKAKALCHIKDENKVWYLFTVVRTFILVTFIKVLPEVGSLKDGLLYWRNCIGSISVGRMLSEIRSIYSSRFTIGIIAMMTLALFIADILDERKPLRLYFARVPRWIRIPVLAALFIAIMIYGFSVTSGIGGFMYAQF